MKKLTCVFILMLTLPLFAQKFNGLALTPPMGWNTWNKFSCNVSEKLIREAADAMVSSGMQEAGYRYIVIDDCWHGQRDQQGFIQPDPQRFPSGMKALADYIHSKGLKFGIYSDAGSQTCGGRPGSRGHEYQDAQKYAEWGVDYLKYDWCYTEGLKAEGAYLTMRDALYAAGRPIILSICEWGSNKPWEWAKTIGHLWRTTGDISAVFDGVVDHGSWKSLGVLTILDMQDGLRSQAGPDHWNDPDMLEVGNGMSVNEDRAHFTMWCMLAAPLMAGNDLQSMSKETLQILTNKEVIGINQDSLGIQGFKYSARDNIEIWFKPLTAGRWAVCFLNRGTTVKNIDFPWSEQAISDSLSRREINFKQQICAIRDLWSGKDLGTTKKKFNRQLPGHDVVLLRLSPLK
jgi:alpha-galactosidase